ncbi:18297_t:CDS:2 [Racocetra fulgida]|uniref:18297_t:CDS:1 n=1 Tax=Racocetra fulgida TaxID=60492 RepID=A0A9N9DLV4_9GLOM|nr:18297_t:CDS:2 [Racocetra fulgida]
MALSYLKSPLNDITRQNSNILCRDDSETLIQIPEAPPKKRIRLEDFQPGQPRQHYHSDASLYILHLVVQDGKCLAVADEEGMVGLIDARYNNTIETGDQTARLWDVELQRCKAAFIAHTCSIKSVNYNSMDPNMWVTASRDGNIFIWDVRTTAVQTTPGEDNSGTRLYANSTDNYIYQYDPINLGAPLARFTSPTFRCSSFYIRMAISPDDRYIISGSSDKCIYMWETDFPDENPIVLKGHENEVTSLTRPVALWANPVLIMGLKIWAHTGKFAGRVDPNPRFVKENW